MQDANKMRRIHGASAAPVDVLGFHIWYGRTKLLSHTHSWGDTVDEMGAHNTGHSAL